MKLQHIIDSAVAMYENGKAIHLMGPPGCGKSQIVENEIFQALQAAYDEVFGFVKFTLADIDAVDVRGFCIPTKDANGKPIAVFTQSAIASAIEATGCERGILFFDERAQAETLTQKAIAPVLQDRVIGNYHLLEGWWIISASNRTTDRSGANKPLAHVTNRERIINVDADIDGVVKFLERKSYHPLCIAFAKARPGVVITNEVPTKDGPYCTPRSFESVCDYLTSHVNTTEDAICNDAITQELMSGDVGEGTAMEMFSFFKVANKLPTKDEIIKNPKKAKVPKDNELDAQYAAMQLCVHHATKDTVDSFFEYITRLKLELQTSAAKSLLEKGGGTLLNSKALSKFIAENRALVINSMS